MIVLSGFLGRNPGAVEERTGADDGSLTEHR
jgi:hypothetical protein